MTIIVAVAAPDGIILAGDSRTTTFPDGDPGSGRYRIYSDTAEKVYEICGRFGVASFGDAFIGQQTIAGVMAEFTAHIKQDPPPDVESFATAIGEFFAARYADVHRAETGEDLPGDAPGQLGLIVAGYDLDGIGHVYEIHVPHGARDPDVDFTTAVQSVLWRGQTDVINRLINGVDWETLGASGVTLPDAVVDDLQGLAYNLLYPIALQDAVDFATFLAQTTIDMQRFSDGFARAPGSVPGCGGNVDILAITRPGARWVAAPVLEARRTRGSAEGAI